MDEQGKLLSRDEGPSCIPRWTGFANTKWTKSAKSRSTATSKDAAYRYVLMRGLVLSQSCPEMEKSRNLSELIDGCAGAYLTEGCTKYSGISITAFHSSAMCDHVRVRRHDETACLHVFCVA